MNQLNKANTPLVFRIGVILLCAVFYSVHLMGGLYARYSTTMMGSAAARVAKIDCAVNYKFSGYGELGDISGDNNTVFALIEEFSVENTGEVSYTYDLKLKLSKDVASATYDSPVTPPNGFSLSAPRNVGTTNDKVTYVYHASANSTTGSTAKKTASELIGFERFTQGKVYYAYSSDGKNYTWVEADLAGTVLSLQKQTLAFGQKHYYRVMYFINVTGSTDLTQQQITLLYNITCEQIN